MINLFLLKFLKCLEIKKNIYFSFQLKMLIKIILFLFSILILSKEEYITIPFQIINNKEPEIFASLDDYFSCWYNLSFYGELSIGTPPQKILTKLSFDDHGISFLNKGCDYDSNLVNINTILYLSNSSSSFQKSRDIYDEKSFNYKNFYDAFYAKDIFYFNSNKKINLKFIYSPNDNQKLSTCLNIGFMAFIRNLRENSINIIEQLKKCDIISSYDWSILLNEGIFLLGGRPHEYRPEKYNEKLLLGSAYYTDGILPYSNLKINKIYFNPNNKIKESIYINDTDILYLNPTKGLIKGSEDYEKKIERYFFNDFIIQKKCFKEFTKDNKYRTFTCINNQQIKSELKSKFPVLKFEYKNFLYTFELNYDDLFKEKGDKIYFLIWFESCYNINVYWEMGFPFMKKYLFNYNYDDNFISYYNNDMKELEIQNSNSNFKQWNLMLILFLGIIVCFLGFILGRKVRKKNKLTAEELETNFNSSYHDKNDMDFKYQE